MAKDLFRDYLTTGRAIPYSATVQTIRGVYKINSGPVLHGCLRHTQRYMDKGKVLALTGEAQEHMEFVHKARIPSSGPSN